MGTPELIDRRAKKAEAKNFLRDAQVNFHRFYALYLIIIILIDFAATVTENSSAGSSGLFGGPLGIFASVLAALVSLILGAGVFLYCFGIRRNQRIEYLSLFDGFSFAGKVILLYLLEFAFTVLWLFLLVIPGFVALYSYRFAIMNLCEDPSISPLEAIRMSKRQTYGYKAQLLMLDLSYFGWYLLANLPMIYFNYAAALSAQGVVLTGAGLNIFLQVLIADAFFLPFSRIYLPHYQVTEIGYYETARRTSGVGPGMVPELPEDDGTF